jgi:endonuclease G
MFVYKRITLYIVIFLLVNCTSKSKQAQIQNSKRINNSISKIKTNLAFYPTSSTNQIVNHTYFTVSYSEKDELPEWVAYRVTPNNISQKVDRTNDYRIDPYVKTESASPDDYYGSGYDMGHLAPARIMAFNSTAMSESFFLSNICPQVPSFNRGIWKRLETKVRYWAALNDSIYVVSGPILDAPISSIGVNNVNVPRGFYKTLLRFKAGKVKGISFLLPNEKSEASIYSYAISIDSLETITGINFYKELEINLQHKVESNKSIKVFISNN